MMEVPIWFYWFVVGGATIILLILIFYFIHKYAKRNAQNRTQEGKPTIVRQSPQNTTERNSGNKSSHYTPNPIIRMLISFRHFKHIIGGSKVDSNQKENLTIALTIFNLGFII